MRIVYMGHNQRGIACLKALKNSRHDVVYAVAQKNEGGWYESIEKTARELNIPVSVEENPNNEEFIKKMRELNPDIIVMCGYSKIIKKDLRIIPKKGCINLHAGKLPHYRGAAPLNWALINGEKEIGLSIIFVDDGIDTGPIIKQEIIEVSIEDTIRDILSKTLQIYPRMLLEVLDEIERDEVKPVIQDPDEGSYYTKRFPKDGLIDWKNMTDIQIYNLIRALTHPYPGAFFYHDGKKVYVWEAKLEKRNYYGVAGRVAARRGEGVVVIAKNRGIRITRVQIEGEEEINAREIFRPGEDLI